MASIHRTSAFFSWCVPYMFHVVAFLRLLLLDQLLSLWFVSVNWLRFIFTTWRAAAQIAILIHIVQTSDRQRFKAVMKFQQIPKPVSFLCGEGAGGTRARSGCLHCSRVWLLKNTVSALKTVKPSQVFLRQLKVFTARIFICYWWIICRLYLCARSLKSSKTSQFIAHIYH